MPFTAVFGLIFFAAVNWSQVHNIVYVHPNHRETNGVRHASLSGSPLDRFCVPGMLFAEAVKILAGAEMCFQLLAAVMFAGKQVCPSVTSLDYVLCIASCFAVSSAVCHQHGSVHGDAHCLLPARLPSQPELPPSQRCDRLVLHV